MHHSTYVYDTDYPTPPPFEQHLLQQDPHDGYSLFRNDPLDFPPVSRTTSPNGSYHSFLQTPTPFESFPALSLELDLSVAGLAIDTLHLPLVETAENDDTISISTFFHPNAQPTPDTIFSSADGVLFYTHAKTILDGSPNAFLSTLSEPLSHPKFRYETIQLDTPSVELNVILHALYGTSPAANSPDFQTLVQAVDRMPAYSLSPKDLIRPSGSVYDLLLSHAPLHPLETYALAAHHELHSLAVSVSSHLLSFDLSIISDAMSERIGAVYVKKLMLLHVERFTSLKAILLQPPHPHAPRRECGFEDQRSLTRAWALVSAYLVWEASSDLSTHSMRAALDPLMEHLTCGKCRQALEDRVKDVVVQWASVKRTI